MVCFMFIWNKYKNQVLGQSNVADIDLTPIVCSCIFCSYCSISYIFSKVLQLNILSILMPLHALLCLAMLGLDIGLLQSLHWTFGRAVALRDKKVKFLHYLHLQSWPAKNGTVRRTWDSLYGVKAYIFFAIFFSFVPTTLYRSKGQRDKERQKP